MCMDTIVEALKEKAINTKDVGFRDAMTLYQFGVENPFRLIACAAEIREHFKGKNVNLCEHQFPKETCFSAFFHRL
jgi:biotin synthase-like enzyme